jgi:peptidoglycan/LPS O-acetylase OafA/YrhL
MYFHPLNFIRFLLALGVLLFHYGTTYFPFNLPVFKTLILHSSFRVSFFFFISGFVMSLVYGQKQQLTPVFFYKRRMSRILPAYWLAFVITLLVVVLIKNASPKGFIILLHFFALQSWDPGYVLDLNFTTWSISVEFFFYLIFPFLLKWMQQMNVRNLLGWAFFIWFFQSVQHVLFVLYLNDGSKRAEEFISAFPLWHFSTFFAGMVTARLILIDSFPRIMRKNSVTVLMIATSLFLYLIYIPNPALKFIHNGLLAPLFSLFIAAMFYDRSLISKWLSHRTVSKLGDLSYGIFIFQYPLWVIMTNYADAGFQTTAWFFFVYLLSVLLISWSVNLFFEKPVMKYLRNNKEEETKPANNSS